jgi:hypothetical protein
MRLTTSNLKYFIPCKNIWLKRFLVILGFVMFDYLVTLTLCDSPFREANVYARAFMETFGIKPGVTLFNLITIAPLYFIFSIDSHLINLPSRITKISDPLVDFIFAWFVAGTRFNGATSWFWNTMSIIRQMSGAALYILIIFFIVKAYGRKSHHNF